MRKNLHPLVYQASAFAKIHHGGVMRKDGVTPYYFHVFKVANTLALLAPNDVNLICAGYLHDILEDTDNTYEDLKSAFNQDVANLVREVTDDKTEYKEMDVKDYRIGKSRYQAQKLSVISDRGFLLKLSDIFANLSDIFSTVQFDPEFAKEFMTEKSFIMNNIMRDTDTHLYIREREIMIENIYGIIDLFTETQL